MGLNGSLPHPFQQGIQQPPAHRLGQNVRDAVQKGFLLPFRLVLGSVSDDGRLGIAAAEAFNAPDALHAHQVHVQNANAGQPVREQRLGFFGVEAVDDAVLFRVDRRPDGFGKVGMR